MNTDLNTLFWVTFWLVLTIGVGSYIIISNFMKGERKIPKDILGFVLTGIIISIVLLFTDLW